MSNPSYTLTTHNTHAQCARARHVAVLVAVRVLRIMPAALIEHICTTQLNSSKAAARKQTRTRQRSDNRRSCKQKLYAMMRSHIGTRAEHAAAAQICQQTRDRAFVRYNTRDKPSKYIYSNVRPAGRATFRVNSSVVMCTRVCALYSYKINVRSMRKHTTDASILSRIY